MSALCDITSNNGNRFVDCILLHWNLISDKPEFLYRLIITTYFKFRFPVILPEIISKYTIELQLTIAHNKKDTTYGWNGFSKAMKLYFLSSQESFVTEDHGYLLIEGLSPYVSFFLFELHFLENHL